MSRFIGTGMDAVLVAGGLDAPDVVSRRRALGHILQGFYFYGNLDRESGWRQCLRDAMKELNPEALAHFDEHENPALTLKLFGGDPFNRAEDP